MNFRLRLTALRFGLGLTAVLQVRIKDNEEMP
jgi:hypothetical protein